MILPSALNDVDNNLVTLFQHGDKEVYTRLYNKYAPAVLGVLSRMVGDKALAEECTNDAFCLIWSKRKDYDPAKERLFTWMIKIAKHCASCLPPEKRNQMADEIREEIDLVYAMDIKSYLQEMQKEQGDNFASGVDVTIREAIHLIYFESHSFAGAAEKIGISVDALREKMIQTIKQIKGSLLA
ncbi:RNA polymerase sigma factor, sigma-70 family [Pedobacter westerhofensis]|uniref:RNA polymerase sigma factor, sigma-70 family n=1 Tax=Pedobacter westerhofensis TaxID=425512 RepID=A0A521C3V4_9SPHI|nr:sigma factor [Pedobacter westerhofensis]SMO54157.1 RNA polymerase sigma factor, sigma-70 family [Pedobacter westerhofensis]